MIYQPQNQQKASKAIRDFGQVSKYFNNVCKLATYPHKSNNHAKIEIRCYFYKKNYTEHNEEDLDEENSIKELKNRLRINKKRTCSES